MTCVLATLNSLSATVSACASCTFETDRAIRGVTPALSACRRPLHRRLLESEKPTVSPQRSPETLQTRRRLFRWCDFFDWSFVGFGFFAMFIRNIQEPSDEAGAALLHDLHILGLFQIVEEPVIFRVAHGILHLLSAPTIKQLRDTVYCFAGILRQPPCPAPQRSKGNGHARRIETRQLRIGGDRRSVPP